MPLSPASANDSGVPPRDGLNAVLWKQNSVEYLANTRAIYELAKIRLAEALADPTWSALDQVDAADKPPAVILDIDDTIFDTGPYQSWTVKANTPYSEATYQEWKLNNPASPIPGSVAFAQHVAASGATVFYITNRAEDERKITLKNMQKVGFPLPDSGKTVLMNGGQPDWTKQKITRRKFVAETYRVLLMIGDHWGDVSDHAFGSEQERRQALEMASKHVGKDWLIIANPEYGNWETAPFNYDFSLPVEQQRQMKIDALKDVWAGPSSQNSQ